MVTVSTFQIEIEVKDKGLLELKKIADSLGVEAASIDAAIERAKKRNPMSIVAPGNNSTFSTLATVSNRQIGIAGLVLSALPILYNTIEFIINDLKDSNIKLTEAEQKSIKNINDAGRVLEEAKKKKRSGVYSVSDEDLAKIIFGVENQRGVEINVKEFLDNLPGDDARFFDEERLKNINRLLENFRTVQDAAEKSTEKLNYTGIKNNEINEESIKLKKEDSQSLLNWDKNTSTAALSARKHGEAIKLQTDQLQRGNEVLELTDEDLLSLEGKYAALANQSGYYTDAVKQTSGETADLVDKNKALLPAQEQINQVVTDGSAAMDNAGASAEQFGEALEQVESSGGFFDGIKQGFIDFVENVESNSELMADFFANTLTEMSQNFSDLFYNVLTGKFDNLQDLAKQAFEAILRAFLDMVAAIATRQIVISIGGIFGLGKSSRSAGGGSGDPLDLAQQGIGVAGSSAGASVGGVMTAGAQAGTFFTPAMEASIMGTGPLVEAGGGILATIGTAATVVGTEKMEYQMAA